MGDATLVDQILSFSAASWAAASGATSPLAIACLLALATLITEDGALAAGALLAGSGAISTSLAVTALIIGIAGGDFLLYAVGRGARQARWLRKRLPRRRLRKAKRWLRGRRTLVLIMTRFIPGSRLPTYLAYGFLRFSFLHFAVVMTIAASVWVSVTVLIVGESQRSFAELGGPAGVIGGAAVALILIVVGPALIRKLGGGNIRP